MFDQFKARRQAARDQSERKALAQTCRTLMSERGEANTIKFATQALMQYQALSETGRIGFFELLASDYAPDPQRVLNAARRYAETSDAKSEVALLRAADPPRQALLRHLNLAPGGTRALLQMRRELLAALRTQPALQAVEADFQHLLASWFSPAFLALKRVDWHSPAHLLEQIIQHEAVHQIRDWQDLRRRLAPDRRCFAFFHPALPDEPLIFVEVALTPQMPSAIAPLLDDAIDTDTSRARWAVFYSISNCQPGLRGVSLGNFLIKQVAEVIQREFPKVNRFCTLSPMPGFGHWLRKKQADKLATSIKDDKQRQRLTQALTLLRSVYGEQLESLPGVANAQVANSIRIEKPLREALLCLGAHYLLGTREHDASTDAVARFHLNNGAQIHRLNVAANTSTRGMQESLGLMVNYLYDLEQIEQNHESFLHGEIRAARDIMAAR
jgi:malonyl-CoA decarboxylase